MKSFLKLLNFEINRLSRYLLGLMALLVFSNILGAFMIAHQHNQSINQLINMENYTYQQAARAVSPLSLGNVFYSGYFTLPMLLGMAFFFLYVFFIWYREWFGKNTFIYRLLMLPISRMTLFFSKIGALFIGMWSLVAVQYLTLALSRVILSWRVPALSYQHIGIVASIYDAPDLMLPALLGTNPVAFLVIYSVLFVLILCLFTAILLERSFKLSGIVYGMGYCLLALGSVIVLFYLPEIFQNYYIIYETERLALLTALLLIISVCSLFLSRYLLKHKLTIY